ncbi:MAG: carboxymuconolactone decarboxylase family protein [Anaerolineae bacterium]
MNPAFGAGKRYYTPAAFLRDLGDFLRHLPDLLRAVRGGRVSRALAEKLMLVVTRVNGCRYCSYLHTRLALRAGVGEEELAQVLMLELDEFPAQEAVALAFAQHYAESDRHPDPEAEHRFRSFYGPEAARDLMAYIRMVTLGNLAGNTVDVFLARLKGQPAPGSSVLGELALFLLFAPAVLLLPLMRRG